MSTRRLSKKVCKKCFEYHGYCFNEMEWKQKRLRCCGAITVYPASCVGEFEKGNSDCVTCVLRTRCIEVTARKTLLIFSGKKIPEWCVFKFEQEIMGND